MISRFSRTVPYLMLLIVLLFSVGTKLSVIEVGAPYVTIDDHTKYEGGFHVWFGQAPPQRMYLESWISGLSSISTYVARHIGEDGAIGLNLVADAYRDFHGNPDPYVLSYRSLMLVVDVLTALLIFLLAREVVSRHAQREWIAAIATSLYLLSFNTLWAYVVARPDTLTVFFSVAGLYLYYRSNFGEQQQTLILSGVMLGLATGMKLHGAFFVIFVCLDLWRCVGLREAIRRAFWFGLVAVMVFAVAAGSVVFDPALYVKLRLLNARDDASPWLEWGDQFVTMLRGTGWLVIPLLIATAWSVRKAGDWAADRKLASVLFLSICWLVLFASIRVLRGYWMLPALPLFYVAAAAGVVRFASGYWKVPVLIALLAVFSGQLWFEGKSFRDVPYGDLRRWVVNKVDADETMYILGYTALNLPLNTSAIKLHKTVLDNGFSEAMTEGESFTHRHIRLWEERARYRLLDMLNFRSGVGYRYFGYHSFPPRIMDTVMPFDSVQYIFVQEHFDLSKEERLLQILEKNYEPVTTLTGPGGGGNGLSYEIYRRK
ncbi:ArnT family glycosyltransferase [Marinobacter sp. GN3S48]|uniref:ArnT family glycosyltransferase n=1 Tax=Marinobacter sp. GN3S48 TaxID=3382302 RepID=UPI00387B0C18